MNRKRQVDPNTKRALSAAFLGVNAGVVLAVVVVAYLLAWLLGEVKWAALTRLAVSTLCVSAFLFFSLAALVRLVHDQKAALRLFYRALLWIPASYLLYNGVDSELFKRRVFELFSVANKDDTLLVFGVDDTEKTQFMLLEPAEYFTIQVHNRSVQKIFTGKGGPKYTDPSVVAYRVVFYNPDNGAVVSPKAQFMWNEMVFSGKRDWLDKQREDPDSSFYKASGSYKSFVPFVAVSINKDTSPNQLPHALEVPERMGEKYLPKIGGELDHDDWSFVPGGSTKSTGAVYKDSSLPLAAVFHYVRVGYMSDQDVEEFVPEETREMIKKAEANVGENTVLTAQQGVFCEVTFTRYECHLKFWVLGLGVGIGILLFLVLSPRMKGPK